jgi:hypothetical protein
LQDGYTVTDPAGQIRVGDTVRMKTGKLRLAVVEVVLDDTIAWCEITEGDKAGYLILRKVICIDAGRSVSRWSRPNAAPQNACTGFAAVAARSSSEQSR